MTTTSVKLPPTNDILLSDLTERIVSGRCHAFVGAGMSQAVYLDWDELIERLCIACGVITENLALQDFSLLELAQAARDKNCDAYFRELHSIFKPKEPTHRHHLLAKLPFMSYLTTNYDSLLLDACNLDGDNATNYSIYKDLRLEGCKDGEVFFLHGRIDHESSNPKPELVLTEKDFEEAYNKTLLRSFLEQLLPFHNVCFFGCSLEDEYLRRIFARCKSFREHMRTEGHLNKARWFILLDQKSSHSDKWTEIGIEPVYYDKVNSDHDGLCTILNDWVGKKPAIRRPLGVDGNSIYEKKEEAPR